MSNKPKKRTMADSPTGVMNRPQLEDLKSGAKEPPQPPPTLPEFEMDEGVTGAMILDAEGEDSAKHADDGPTKSATKY